MKRKHLYSCGRCGYKSNSKVLCPTCNIHLEEECNKCLNAKGNCVCRIHGMFKSGKHKKSHTQKIKKITRTR